MKPEKTFLKVLSRHELKTIYGGSHAASYPCETIFQNQCRPSCGGAPVQIGGWLCPFAYQCCVLI